MAGVKPQLSQSLTRDPSWLTHLPGLYWINEHNLNVISSLVWQFPICVLNVLSQLQNEEFREVDKKTFIVSLQGKS